MIADQGTLKRLFAEMLSSRGYRIEELVREDGKWQLDEPADAIHGLVVLQRFDLQEYVLGTFAFLASLDRVTLDRWYQNFTKTLFLIGAPEKIAARVDILRHRVDDSVAWATPGDSKAHLGLRRLLKPLFTSCLPSLPERVECKLPPAEGPLPAARSLQLRLVRTRSLESYLVHLNHVLCEAFITQMIRPGDGLTILHVDEIRELPESFLHVRVHLDGEDAAKLRAYAYLVAGAEGA